MARGEYLRCVRPVTSRRTSSGCRARARGAPRRRSRPTRPRSSRRAADPDRGPQGFEAVKPRNGAVDLLPKWDCYQMGYAPDGATGSPRRRRQAVLRLPRRRPPGDPRRRRGGGHVGAPRGRLFEKATPKVRKGDRRADRGRQASFLARGRRSVTTLDRLGRPHAPVVRGHPARRARRPLPAAPAVPALAGPPGARRAACRAGAAAARRARPSPRARRSRPCRRPAGQTTTGQPQASARISVPWPPCVTTRSQAGIVCE